MNNGYYSENQSLPVVRRCGRDRLHWEKLSAGGDPKAQQCGWLKDKYGLSWQVVPSMMSELFKDDQSPGAQRAMEAMLRMKKLDIAALRRAYDGAA